MIKRTFVAILVIAIAGQALAVYKCTDSTGRMTFQDRACDSSKSQANVKVWKDDVADDPSRTTTLQKKYCKSVGKIAEDAVDLYISGTSRSEALQRTPERHKAVIDLVYHRLERLSTIRNQDVRSSIKTTEGLSAEINCMQSFSSK